MKGQFLKKVRSVIPFFSGLCMGSALTLIGGFFLLKTQIILETECHSDFITAQKKLTETINRYKMWEIKPVSCGFPLTADSSRISMFQLCNAKYAPALLNHPNSRKAAAFIPCRAAIYEKEGKTYLARLNVRLLGRLIGYPADELFNDGIAPDQEFFWSSIERP